MSGEQASIRAIVNQARDKLLNSNSPELSDSPELDAQLLLAKVLNKPRSWLYAWPEFELAESQLAQFQRLLQARLRGEPIAYLLGEREFWKLRLQVTPDVLIPRPETELLVETALEMLDSTEAVVADLGTGSGAIALALANERPNWQVYASDASASALAVAAANCRALALTNVSLLQGSWCEPLPAAVSFDLLVSNPPYIEADDPHLQSGDVRFEPRSALVAADQGLADLKTIAQQALARLASQGLLLLEHGWEQGASVRQVLQSAGYAGVETRVDLSGRERVTLGRKP